MKEINIKANIDPKTNRIGTMVHQVGFTDDLECILETIAVLEHLKALQLDKLKSRSAIVK